MNRVEQVKDLIENGYKVLIFKEYVMIVSVCTLYDPSNHIHFNKFKGKFVPENYLQGNFERLHLAVDKFEDVTLTIPANMEYIYIS